MSIWKSVLFLLSVAIISWIIIMALLLPSADNTKVECEEDMVGITYKFPVYSTENTTYYYGVYHSIPYTITADDARSSLNTAELRQSTTIGYTESDFADRIPGSSVELCRAIAAELNDRIAETESVNGFEYSDWQKMMVVLVFVWSTVKYSYDIDMYGLEEWWSNPLETIYFGKGDCDDSAILYYCIAKEMGLDAVMVNAPGHCTCAVAVEPKWKDRTVEKGGRKYVVVEPTLGSGYDPGGNFKTAYSITESDPVRATIISDLVYRPSYFGHLFRIPYILD